MSNYYDILGVDKQASPEDIKKQYRKLAQEYHPDRNQDPSAKEKFQQINTAYQTLKDPEKRAAYDNPRPQGIFGGRSGFSGGLDEMIRRMAEEAMQNTHTYGTRRSYKMANVDITLEQAFNGTTLTFNGQPFNVPAGVRTGNQLLIDDIVIVIRVQSHPKFQRSQDDLVTSVQISAIEAMLGVECKIKNIDGKTIKVKIPAGIQYGQLVKVAGKGMPNPEFDHRGDLLVQVAVSIPSNLTDSERDSIMKIDHRTSFDA